MKNAFFSPGGENRENLQQTASGAIETRQNKLQHYITRMEEKFNYPVFETNFFVFVKLGENIFSCL